MAKVEFLFLNRADVEAAVPDMSTVIDVVEKGLIAHGKGQVVLPPKSHLLLDDRFNGHLNILHGYVEPVNRAGVKVISDYVDNYRYGLPSEIALLTLYDPQTGRPVALLDATVLTWLRTGAVTGIGAKHLARRDAKVVGHIGARGTALGNLAALAELFELDEVRIASKRQETREALAEKIEAELGIRARAVDSIRDAVVGADIVVEATRLERPQVLIEDAWLAPGVLLITYGWVMAIDPQTVAAADKLVVDDWAQCKRGGALFPLIESGELRDEHVHAEIGRIACGDRPGRTGDAERILFWHRGFAVSDIVLGHWIVEQSRRDGRGVPLLLWDGPDE